MVGWILLLAAPAAAARLPCSSATGDCVINPDRLAVGVYDIRPRNLVVKNKAIDVTGSGELRILANNVTLLPGARLVAALNDGITTITLDAAGTMNVQSQGTSKSKINVTGGFGGGSIKLHAVGNLTLNGALFANATTLLGYGGPISISSDTGNVSITGDPDAGVKSVGGAQGGGGTISVTAPLGSIFVSTQLAARAGDCSGCAVDLDAGTTVTTTAQGFIDLSATGTGDGGSLTVTAGGDVRLAGNVFANASSFQESSGSGGAITIDTPGALTMSGRVELNGTSPDGDGGAVDATAGTTILVTGQMFGLSKGFGLSDEFFFDGGGDVTIAGTLDVSGVNFGGDITIFSSALVTISGRLRTAAPTDPVASPAARGGDVDVEGCALAVTASGQIVDTGVGAAALLAGSTRLTIAGSLTSTLPSELQYRTTRPVITGLATPTPRIVQNALLPCCGDSCPSTTTTTSTTTTSTAPEPTTTQTTTTTTSSTSESSSTSTSTSFTTTSSSTTRPTSTSATSTTTPTSTTSTTTLLVAGCASAPIAGCQSGAKVQLLVNEKRFGKEQIRVLIGDLRSTTSLAFFGDPVAGATAYSICLYDAANAPVASLRVERAQQRCGTAPCWRTDGTAGYKYGDRLLAASGVLQVQTKSGPSGTGRVLVNAKRDLPHNLLAMPVGVAAQLVGNRRATVQIVSSDAGCVTGTVDDVSSADGVVFRGRTP